jgi:hypothetical protein
VDPLEPLAQTAQWVLIRGQEGLLGDGPEDWELLLVDEASVRRHPTLTAQWGLVDDTPEVPTGDDHAKVHVYGAVAPLTGRSHYHISPEWGKGDFAPFLQHLLANSPCKRLPVIHDRGEQHTSLTRQPLVDLLGQGRSLF